MQETIKFGDRLQSLRKENDLTIDEFVNNLKAKHDGLKLDKSIVSRYENNIHTPKQFTLVQYIADYFGVTVEYLMGRSDNKYDDDTPCRSIPILGTIAAGLPLFAEEHIIGYEYIDINAKADFCLKVKGTSMINARIFDGDIVYIRKQPDVETGEIAAVIIDGEEATLKRVYKANGTLILRPENPEFKDMVFSSKDMKDVKIIGKAVSFKSEVR